MYYDPKQLEAKWQQRWEENKTFSTPADATADNKYYILPQLPYPSGSGLHVGHAEVYTACDILARFKRMQGEKVLQVIGWDSFGLPAENYAIKTNVHPRESTNNAVNNFRNQIKSLGISVDWDREVGSHTPEYYKWTQWLFQLMYKRGLAYRKKQAVNWCESCKTVLANEQVVDGHCERCDTVVIQKEMEQWYLRITDYADRLLEGLDRIDWPEETKKRQRDWIGRSEGASITFNVIASGAKQSTGTEEESATSPTAPRNDTLEVFTTRPDTIFGATYMVVAPEHALVAGWLSEGMIENADEVQAYIDATAKKSDLDRQIDQEKTGVELKGIKAVNPVNGEEIPVWIADYVLASYGTGAIMAVPAHDERDFAFAKKFGMEVRCVIRPESLVGIVGDNDKDSLQAYFDSILDGNSVYSGDGKHINSDILDGLYNKQAITESLRFLEEKGVGKREVNYKLRDWSVSRQRFWGAPIPMVRNEDEMRKKRQFVLLHGFEGRPDSNYFPALKKFLESEGHTVVTPELPNTMEPNVDDQAKHVLDTVDFDEDTVLLGHSLGGPVVFRLLEQLDLELAKVVLSDSFYIPTFVDKTRPAVEAATNWNFDMSNVKGKAREWIIVADDQSPIIPREHSEQMARELDARLVWAKANDGHFDSTEEPVFYEELPVSGIQLAHFADLPVRLPDDVDFKPTGQSPLTYSETFQDGVAEQYGEGWQREVDTLDTFMCSSWYFFRYLDPHNDKAFASEEALKKWMPVDFYLGGAEHVNGHLLYSRFLTKVLFDVGYIDFDEPFTVHRHQGLILGEDNRKMSKRWGNVINPTDVVNEYGADTCRMYEMFMGPLEETKPWDTNGVKGVRRFLDRIWRFVTVKDGSLSEKVVDAATSEEEVLMHKTIKKVTEDTATLGFNTAIASMMEFINFIYKQETIGRDSLNSFVLLLAPYAPHMAEELWEMLGNSESIATAGWPTYDESKLIADTITIVVQVNGKVRDQLELAADITREDAETAALASEKVQGWLDGQQPKKVIYVPGKLVSIVM